MEATNSSLSKVQQAYQDFASGNLQALIDNTSADVVWNSHLNPASPFYGDHKGIESFEEYFAVLANEDIHEVNVHTAIESGHRSIILIDIKGMENYIHVLRFARGRVIQVDIYNKNAVA